MGRTPEQMAEDTVFILKPSGDKLGPYKAAVDSKKNLAEIFERSFVDIVEGDKLLRPVDPTKEEAYEILEVHHKKLTHGVFAEYELEIRRQGAPEEPSRGGGANSYTFNNSNVQIGDHNVQDIINMFLELASEIDKADAPPEQKEEVKGFLRAALSHPVMTSIMGGAASALTLELLG